MTIFPYTQGAYFMLIILLSMAMGMQTAAARKLNVAGISTTVLTSTLANLFEDLAQRLSNREKSPYSTCELAANRFYCLLLPRSCFSCVYRCLRSVYHHLAAYLHPRGYCDHSYI